MKTALLFGYLAGLLVAVSGIAWALSSEPPTRPTPIMGPFNQAFVQQPPGITVYENGVSVVSGPSRAEIGHWKRFTGMQGFVCINMDKYPGDLPAQVLGMHPCSSVWPTIEWCENSTDF